jgi:integrase
MEPIKVYVTKPMNRPYWRMYYYDPITEKQVSRSTKTITEKAALKAATKWEDELLSGMAAVDSRITWDDFRERYEDEKLSGMSPRTREIASTVFGHVERFINPASLSVIAHPRTLSTLQTKLRKSGINNTTIAGYLSHLRSALSWARDMEYISHVPRIKLPRTAGQKVSGGRPLTRREFERMLYAVPQVRPDDPERWRHFLRGLWLSGFRLSESLLLSWDKSSLFAVDFSGRYPQIRISAKAQKNRKNELWRMPPDFAQFLLETPKEDRTGHVFKMHGQYCGTQRGRSAVGNCIGDIGKAAGIVTCPIKPSFATANDFRRSFGTRWAPKVMPAVLQKLMRHASIKTTMQYYVDIEADDIAEVLWRDHAEPTQKIDDFIDASEEQNLLKFPEAATA